MSKPNIILVTGPRRQCGIHAYSSNVFNLLSGSEKYNFYLAEIGSEHELMHYLSQYDVDGIIYNWHPMTTAWLTSDVTRRIAVPQFYIDGHDCFTELDNTKAEIHIAPVGTDPRHHSPRPVIFYDDIVYSPPQGRIKLGTSGFGHDGKKLPEIMRIINAQYTEDDVDLRLHLSLGDYIPGAQQLAENIGNQARSMANPNIHVEITHAFLEHRELVAWMNQNDINIFYYDYGGIGNSEGVSASMDLALSARKPIAVNESVHFRHVYDESRDLTKTPIRDIIAAGVAPLQPFYDAWNQRTMIEFYENIMNPYFNGDVNEQADK